MTKETILAQYSQRKKDYTWNIYQPIPLLGYEETYEFSGRKCTDRMDGIRNYLNSHFPDKKLKILDIGCNNGYFCFELAKDGHHVTGIDTNKKFIDTCDFLKDNTTELKEAPVFLHKECAVNDIPDFTEYDVVLCFSVIHHFKNKTEFLNKLSRFCNHCIIEMDGNNFGKTELLSHFYSVKLIAETNDPYGSGFKKRRTWVCDNTKFKNLKTINYIRGRGVFGDNKIVTKREIMPTEHTWLKTNLAHEQEIYRKYQSEFIPNFIEFNEQDNIRELTIEFVDNSGIPSLSEIERLYDFLESQNLFIIDFVRDMILFDKNNKIKLIDLESIFDISNQPIIDFLKKEKKLPYDTYEKQIDFLKKLYKL